MLNNFIYAQTKELFLTALENHQILDEAIVFIEDTKEIWNHGHYFAGRDLDTLNELSLEIDDIKSELETKLVEGDLADYALKTDIPNLDPYLKSATASETYVTLEAYNPLKEQYDTLNETVAKKLDSNTAAETYVTNVYANDNLQIKITNLEDIKDGAGKGKTAIQPGDFNPVKEGLDNLKDTVDDIVSNVQSDWNATEGLAAILNKPDLSEYLTVDTASDTYLTQDDTDALYLPIQEFNDFNADFTEYQQTVESTYAKSDDLPDSYFTQTDADELYAGKGIIETVNGHTTAISNIVSNVQSDWNATEGLSAILNKPTNLVTTADLEGAIADLIGSAPDTLNTLQELSAALGDDANFATNVLDAIGEKADSSALADYLLKSGGTIAGGFGALNIKRDNNPYASGIQFSNSAGVLGYIGFNDDYSACIWDSSTAVMNTLIHSGNIGSQKVAGLATPITIWGQSFDGTSNVSGKITTDSYVVEGMTSATSVSSIPITHGSCKCTISANGAFSLADVPEKGRTIHILIYNSGSSAVTVTFPTTGGYHKFSGDNISIASKKYAEVSVFSDGETMFIRAGY